MLRVKINNQFVELFENAGIKYVFNSPAFSESALVGDFSYSMSFPDSEHNARILGFISNPALYNNITEHSCEIYEDNNFILTSIFRVTSTKKGDKISGNIINTAYDFINKIKNLTTKDLDLGGDHVFSGGSEFDVFIINMMQGSYPTYKIAQFPILNETYKDGTPEEEEWMDKLYINPYNPANGPNVFFPYLAFIIDQIFIKFGLSVNNIIGQHEELKKLCLIGLMVDPHVTSYIGYNLHYHVLKVDLTKLLDAIKSTFGTAFFFNNKTNQVKMVFQENLLTITGDYVDWTDKVLRAPAKKFDYKDNGFMLSHNFDSSDTTMSEFQLEPGILENAVISESVLTPFDLPVYENMGSKAGEIRFVTCEQCFYIIVDIDTEPTIDYQWQRLSWNFFGKKVGEGLNEKQSQLTTLGMNWHVRKMYSKTWMTPHSNQVLLKNPLTGSLSLLHSGENNYNLVAPIINDFEPRVLFYRGWQPDFYDNQYPLGTSGKFDAKGNVIGSLTMNWDGEDGLHENFWKKWLAFIDNSVPEEVPVNLNIRDILSLDLSKQYKIESNYYLIKKLSIDFPITKEATAEIVRI